MHENEDGRIIRSSPHIHFDHVDAAFYRSNEGKSGLARPLTISATMSNHIDLVTLRKESGFFYETISFIHFVKLASGDDKLKECLVFCVTMRVIFQDDRTSEANKYSIIKNLEE